MSASTTNWPVHGHISGPIVIIGFGSIGKGVLPLIERHFTFDKSRLAVIDPIDADRALVDERGLEFVNLGLTKDNYRDVLTPLLSAAAVRAFASTFRSTRPRWRSWNCAAKSARCTSTP